MANDLTGDFDVVVEFAIPAANRMLAAMLRSERFLHSLTLRVVDTPRPGPVDRPTIVAAVDTFGDPITDHTRVGSTIAPPGRSFTADTLTAPLDQVVNPEMVGATVDPIVPSHLQGRAQLQLSPPTVEVPDGVGTNLRVRLRMMARTSRTRKPTLSRSSSSESFS